MKFLFPVLLGVAATVGCGNRTPLAASAPGARIDGAVDLGSIAPDTQLDLVVGLALRQPAALHRFLDAQQYTRDVLTAEDFGDHFGVSPGEYARVVTWLGAQGFTITRTTPGRTTISVRGRADTVERAFGARVHDFEDALGRFSAAVEELSLAPEIAPSVSGVVGVEGGLPWVPHLVHPALPPGGGGTP
jgi:subtilase family serine protease